MFLSFSFSFKGNVNVAPESSGEDALNRAAAEEVSSGTESCRNSSPEREEPGKERAHTGLERCEVAALSLPLTGREMRRVEFLTAGLVLPSAFSSNPALTQPPCPPRFSRGSDTESFAVAREPGINLTLWQLCHQAGCPNLVS